MHIYSFRKSKGESCLIFQGTSIVGDGVNKRLVFKERRRVKPYLKLWSEQLNRWKDLNRTVLDVTIRGMKIPILYLTEDAEAMRRKGHLDILLKVDFAENQPSSTPCAPNAQRCDQAYVCVSSVPTSSRRGKECIGVVGNSGIENIDAHTTMSDEFSGRPREEKRIENTLYLSHIGSFVQICIRTPYKRTEH